MQVVSLQQLLNENHLMHVAKHQATHAAGAMPLQELGFKHFMHHAEHSVSHAAHDVAHGLSTAAKKVGPYASWAATQTWHGAQACAANPTCQAAVEEYGTDAVEAAMALQNLSFGSWLSGAAHTVEHDVSSAAKAVGPYASWAAKETWQGAQACDANPTCKAAVEKYGTEAVEAAMKKGLMELNWFSGAINSVKNEADKVAGDVTHTFNGFKSASEAAAKKYGPDFKIAGQDLQWAAGKTWQGAEWCYNTAPCKAAAEKYGMAAVQAGMMAAALQNLNLWDSIKKVGSEGLSAAEKCGSDANCRKAVEDGASKAYDVYKNHTLMELNWFSGAVNSVKHEAEKVGNDISAAAKAVGPYAEWAGKETWQGATWCYSNPTCKAAAEKYGTEAVEAAMTKKSMIILL